jgi:hypothetical protein
MDRTQTRVMSVCLTLIVFFGVLTVLEFHAKPLPNAEDDAPFQAEATDRWPPPSSDLASFATAGASDGYDLVALAREVELRVDTPGKTVVPVGSFILLEQGGSDSSQQCPTAKSLGRESPE